MWKSVKNGAIQVALKSKWTDISNSLVYSCVVLIAVPNYMTFSIEINTSQFTYFHEIRVFCITNGDHSMHLFNQLLLFIIVKVHIPFGQSSFARTILY